MKKYGLVAINDEESVCSVCGKVELKRVMWLVALSPEDGTSWDGEPFPVGTTCGAKMLGYTTGKMTTRGKQFEREKDRFWWCKLWEYQHTHGYNECLNKLSDLQIMRLEGYEAYHLHPLYIEAKRIDGEAHAYANSEAKNFTLTL